MKSLHLISGLLLAVGAATAQQYTVNNIAGQATTEGYFGDGGPALAAQLDMPLRVAVDAKGNYYVVDYLTHVIRMVTPAGVISTLAGTGAFGFSGDGGIGTQGILSDVHGIAVDSSGNVFLADTANGRVRRIDNSTQFITTVAGNGNFGYAGDGSAAVNATLARPAGVAVDSSGNLYIADYGNYTVRKVDAKGIITTLAGNGNYGFSGDGGAAGKALLANPLALALDAAGDLFIGDSGNLNIREITTDGNIKTVVTGVDAESIAIDAAGNIIFPNYSNSTIQKILPNGSKVVIAGNGLPGSCCDGINAASAQFNQPYGVAIDSQGRIYVADSGNQLIRLLTPIGASLSVVNAASNLGSTITPGEIVVLYGSGIGPATLVANQPVGGYFGTQLAGTTVTVGGLSAPLIYTSGNQVAAIVPYSVIGGTSPNITVTYKGNSLTANLPVVAAAPGVFTADSSGGGQVAAVNQDGTANSAAHPAKVGGFVSLYITGDGYEINPGSNDGQLSTPPYSTTYLPVKVTIAGQTATVSYSGSAPGFVAGLTQVNVKIPLLSIQTFASGAVSIPLTVQVGNFPAQTGITLFVALQ
jgi:uncharacterized protein (TIGR03437 family)